MRQAILLKALPKLLGKINALMYLCDKPQGEFETDLVALIGFVASIDLTKFSSESLSEVEVLVQRILIQILTTGDVAKFDAFRNAMNDKSFSVLLNKSNCSHMLQSQRCQANLYSIYLNSMIEQR